MTSDTHSSDALAEAIHRRRLLIRIIGYPVLAAMAAGAVALIWHDVSSGHAYRLLVLPLLAFMAYRTARKTPARA
jgi:hypothetical protein